MTISLGFLQSCDRHGALLVFDEIGGAPLLSLKLHPDDAQILKSDSIVLRRGLRLEEDTSLPRGDAVLQTERSKVVISISNHVEQLRQAMFN